MKKLNSAIITFAAVMSMSASAMAAPLCTSTLNASLQSCLSNSSNCNLSTSVLACTSGSLNCDIDAILSSNCSDDLLKNFQNFTDLESLTDNADLANVNCNLSDILKITKTTTDKTPTDKTTTDKTATDKTTTDKTTTDKTTTDKTTTDKTTTDKTATDKTTTDKTTTDKTTTDKTTSNTSVSAYAQEVVNLVNAERAKEGLSALSIDSKVTAAAQVRATEIKTSFSHTRPDGRSCFTALAEAGASYSGAGENIAIGQKTPSEVVTAWMNSPGHRANIMNANFKYIGVGVNGTAWAQLFTY